MRSYLEGYGKLQYLENHHSEQSDIVVKYKSLSDSKTAYKNLKQDFFNV